jgi:UDP-3-O-[3-hydroxymyristoyl] glucosamine N-acyltransferase
MLVNSNNLPIMLLGDTSISEDLYYFLKNDYTTHIVRFEEIENNPDLYKYQYFVGVFKDLKLRQRILTWVNTHGVHQPGFVHQKSYVEQVDNIGAGSMVFPMASVLPANIGKNCLIAPHCHVGHRSTIKDNCFLLPGAMVLGSVFLEENTILQTKAAVLDGLTVSVSKVNILPDSMVTKDIAVAGTYGGSPARRISGLLAQESKHFK